MECKQCGSEKVENKDLMLCASCAYEMRKAERMKAKQPKQIKKVSEKRKHQLTDYAKIREKFLLRKWCAYHGKPCLPTTVHHAKGRVGYADDKMIPLLIDDRYFVPLCSSAHQWVTEHSNEAIQMGLSELRTK